MAISATNVTAIYNGGKPNDIGGINRGETPIAHYRFEGISETDAIDSGGAQPLRYNGTLYNSPVRQHDTP